MKFTLSRSAALTMLQQALKTCDTKAKGQLASEFLFKPTDDESYLTVTSFTDFAEQNIQVAIEDLELEGCVGFSVNGFDLVELLKNFPDEEITCVYAEDKAIFVIASKQRKTKFALPAGIPDDFVLLSVAQTGARVAVSGTSLATALRLTAFATSREYTKAPQTAVKMTLEGTTLLAEASDNERISKVSLEIEDIGPDVRTLLIPYTTAEILSTMLDGIETVTLVPCLKHIQLEWDDTLFTSNLENGVTRKFPALSKYMSGTEHANLKVSRTDILRAVKMASLLAKDSSVCIKANLDDGIIISTNEKDRGASLDVVPAQTGTGAAEVHIATKILLKGIETTSSPFLTLSFRAIQNNLLCIVLVDGEYEHCIFPVSPKSDDGEQEADGNQQSD